MLHSLGLFLHLRFHIKLPVTFFHLFILDLTKQNIIILSQASDNHASDLKKAALFFFSTENY